MFEIFKYLPPVIFTHECRETTGKNTGEQNMTTNLRLELDNVMGDPVILDNREIPGAHLGSMDKVAVFLSMNSKGPKLNIIVIQNPNNTLIPIDSISLGEGNDYAAAARVLMMAEAAPHLWETFLEDALHAARRHNIGNVSASKDKILISIGYRTYYNIMNHSQAPNWLAPVIITAYDGEVWPMDFLLLEDDIKKGFIKGEQLSPQKLEEGGCSPDQIDIRLLRPYQNHITLWNYEHPETPIHLIKMYLLRILRHNLFPGDNNDDIRLGAAILAASGARIKNAHPESRFNSQLRQVIKFLWYRFDRRGFRGKRKPLHGEKAYRAHLPYLIHELHRLPPL